MYTKQQLTQQKLPKLPARRTDAIYRARGVAYIAKSRLAMSGRLLIVSFYSRESAANGFSLPSVILFQTKTEFVALQHGPDGQKWKGCRLLHALRLDRCGEKQVICLTERDEKRIRSFLPPGPHSGKDKFEIHRHIEDYQDNLAASRLKAKKTRTAEAIDARMKDTPRLPEAFARWIDREPLINSRYVFYRRVTKRKAEGFCTHCKNDFILTAEIPAHNERSTCPSCRSQITYKAIGKATKLRDESHAAILQKSRNSGEYVLRYFEISRSFTRDYREPDDWQYEKARLFFKADGTITGQFRNGWSSKTDRYGWHPTNDVITGTNKEITWEKRYGVYTVGWNVWFRPAMLYSYNLRPMLTGLNMSYDIIRNIKGREVDVTSYLMRGIAYPFAPSLWRIGLSRLCGDLLEECFEPENYRPSGALHTRFGVSKAFMASMREHNLGIEAVRLRAHLPKEPDMADFLWMLKNKVKGRHVSQVIKYATFHKMKKYIEKQVKVCRLRVYGDETRADRLIGIWKDYISMRLTLGYDLKKKSVLFPKRVNHEHDKIQQLVKIKHDPVMDERIKALYPGLEEIYSFADGNFLIRPPKDFDDFIDEGANLLHCVCANEYYRGHVERKSYIFFLRRAKNPDIPYYTIEYAPDKNSIRQCQGYRHKNQTADIQAFTEKWLLRVKGKHVALKAA
jgi:hypothetical protein